MVGGHFVRTMGARRRLSAACSTVLIASALVVAPFLMGSASAAELIQDGGFETATGTPPNSPSWTEADSLNGTPLCSSTNCSTTSSTYSAAHRHPLGQVRSRDVVQPHGQPVPGGGHPRRDRRLTYWYRNGLVTSPFTATLQVRVDGTTVRTHTEASTAQSSYTQQTVDLSAYANGASHTISFNYANNSSGENRMTVDDVSLNHTQPVTGTPTVTSTVPGSPASSTTPLVKGTAETGSTVTLYSNSTCTSTVLGTGTAADFAGAGITATVPANATTTIRARATKSGQTASACSATSVAYTNDSTAPGLVTSRASRRPRPTQHEAAVRDREAGSTVRLYSSSGCTGPPAATGTGRRSPPG